MEPLSKEIFPRAIVHFDGDSFLPLSSRRSIGASKGKPVVVGAERGAPTAVSVEAKRLGLSRGMTMKQIRAKCPQVVVVNSIMSRMSFMRGACTTLRGGLRRRLREYSIDECFADITGLDKALRKSYEEIAQDIQRTLHAKLGITFGVGLAPTKVLAKTASKFRKPAGFTAITRARRASVS